MTLPTFEKFEGLTKLAFERMDEVLDAIKGATFEKPVLAQKICDDVGLPATSNIRGVVSYARSYDNAPIGSSQDGYWWAHRPEELATTIEHISGRISKMKLALTGLKTAQERISIEYQFSAQRELDLEQEEQPATEVSS